MVRQVTSVLSLLAVMGAAPERSIAGKTKFVLDGNRIYAALGFVRPDGSLHRALAFVDMGSPRLTLRGSLLNELQLGRKGTLSFKIGDAVVQVPASDVVSDPRPPASVGADLKVEGTLPAAILQRYVVVIDYREHSFALAGPGTLEPRGIAVPFSINPATGLIVVQAFISGTPYALTIDNGSAYTWVRQTVAKEWVAAHPEWERGVGAVGPSNMMMSGDTTETEGTLVRIPEIAIGAVSLRDVGALAAGPTHLIPGYADFFDWYSEKNPVPVIGWIGGNVLKHFRLTLDYPKHTMYWQKQSDPDSHDLDQVGLTLRSDNGAFYVAAIATKNGSATVSGVLPGDELVRVGHLELSSATWGDVFRAMHGAPGQSRALVLDRHGETFKITAGVTRF